MSAGHHHPPAARSAHSHDHSHGHGHGHGHGHHHHPAPAAGDMGKAFALAVALNLAFVCAETVAGFMSGSMALLADAGHNLSDVLSLLLAWAASVLAMRPPSERFTYGLKSSSILAAIANAALLWVAIGAILVETVRSFIDPSPVQGGMMMIVAGIGIAVNALSALLFAKGAKSDLNLRAAFVHLMADAAVSLGVVIAGLAITWTGIAVIDPAASLLITAVIAWSSWGLLRDSLRMGMLGVPDAIDLAAVRTYLEARPGVTRVHDLHIWPMSTTETALTVHLVMPDGASDDGFLGTLAHDLQHQFAIGHPTIQIETHDTACALECEAVA
ncbi:cation diffusion facilitator family transporter [Novosphingobium sp. Rr 2-17]|uniref:cation diffusion facilitator family transporter n=1 Tax=Novosphingobium sp. Rr 2-17 TaxID=555793 RepID=UPI0002698552|nr:cation diffusion facilitator family transporter [Novosphingobium sp. Rr 2-17]EIZ78586.1 cation diffusion facilitator family transporter [Novosphingobium sp. Rr 2-17]